MTSVMKDIVTWLKQWYYTEPEVDTLIGGLQTQINNKADSSTVSALDTTVSGKADKTGGAAQITDANANNYTNIGSLSSDATQQAINDAINTKIGTLMSIDWIQVVSTLPTASASTMGKLYLVAISGASGTNVFEEYVTVKDTSTTPTSYSWEELGELSASSLSISWSNITDKPSSYTPSSHTHGQVTNDGKITSTAVTVASGDNIVITDASDSSKVKRVANLLAGHIKDSTAHSNIGSSANATQETINSDIDTALSNKANKTAALGTTITLIDKGETNEGCIVFNTIS